MIIITKLMTSPLYTWTSESSREGVKLVSVNEWMNEQTNERTNEPMNEWMERTNEWMFEWRVKSEASSLVWHGEREREPKWMNHWMAHSMVTRVMPLGQFRFDTEYSSK